MKKPILYAENHNPPLLIKCCGCGDIKPQAYRRSDNEKLRYCAQCADKLPHLKLDSKEYAIALKAEHFRHTDPHYRRRTARFLGVSDRKVDSVIDKLNKNRYEFYYEPENIVINSKGVEVGVNNFQAKIIELSNKYLLRHDYHECIANELKVNRTLVSSAIGFLKSDRKILIPSRGERRQNLIKYVHELINQNIPRSSLIKKAARQTGYTLYAIRGIVEEYEKQHGRVKQYSTSEILLEVIAKKGAIARNELSSESSLDGGSVKWALQKLIKRGEVRRVGNLIILNKDLEVTA